MRSNGIEIQEVVPILGADRFFSQDPDGHSIELIQWFNRWEGNRP